jgi:hypothetical protein
MGKGRGGRVEYNKLDEGVKRAVWWPERAVGGEARLGAMNLSPMSNPAHGRERGRGKRGGGDA